VGDHPDGADGAELDALVRMLHDALVRDEVESMDGPHVVITQHFDGSAVVEGPFSSALVAMVVAEDRLREIEESREDESSEPDDSGRAFTITVAPLVGA
jgi:hypothetical protein